VSVSGDCPLTPSFLTPLFPLCPLRVVLEQQVQAAGLAVGGVDRAADEPERIIEARDQLRRDHILGKDLYWLGDTDEEVEDKVALSTRPGRSGMSAVNLSFLVFRFRISVFGDLLGRKLGHTIIFPDHNWSSRLPGSFQHFRGHSLKGCVCQVSNHLASRFTQFRLIRRHPQERMRIQK
jgi:hypothetical protein